MSPTTFLSTCRFPTDISSLTSSRIHRSFQHVTLTKPQLLMLNSKLPTVRAHICTTVLQPSPSTTCISLCFSHLSFYYSLHSLYPISDFPEDLPQDPLTTGLSLSLLSPLCKIPSLTLSSVAVLLTSTHFHLVHSGFIGSVC